MPSTRQVPFSQPASPPELQTTRQLPPPLLPSRPASAHLSPDTPDLPPPAAPADGSRFPPDYPDHCFFRRAHIPPGTAALPSSPCWYSTEISTEYIRTKVSYPQSSVLFHTLPCQTRSAAPVLMQETIHPFPPATVPALPGGPVLKFPFSLLFE